MEDQPLDRQKFKLLPPSEREYVELSQEELKKRYKNPESTVLQYNNRIKYRVINAITEIAWLCDRLPEDRLKKIFLDELMEPLFKLQEKALRAFGYPLGEEYEVEVELASGEKVKAKRGKGIDTWKHRRLETHMDAEIDALTFNSSERDILKRYIRRPDELVELLEDLWENQVFLLASEYSKGQITDEEYTERLNSLKSKLRERKEL